MKEQLIINKEKVEYLSVGREILVQSVKLELLELKCKNKLILKSSEKLGNYPKPNLKFKFSSY